MRSFPKASIINSERARFELAGNTRRMVASIRDITDVAMF